LEADEAVGREKPARGDGLIFLFPSFTYPLSLAPDVKGLGILGMHRPGDMTGDGVLFFLFVTFPPRGLRGLVVRVVQFNPLFFLLLSTSLSGRTGTFSLSFTQETSRGFGRAFLSSFFGIFAQ